GQPGDAPDAVGAAGGDGRGPGDGRGRHPSAAAPLLRDRHPEPARVPRHLPAPGGPARPLPGRLRDGPALDRGGRGGARQPPARRPHHQPGAGPRPRRGRGAAGVLPAGGGRGGHPRLHRLAVGGDSRPAGGGAAREHAGGALPAAGLAGAGGLRRARLRAPRRRQGAGDPGPRPPARHARPHLRRRGAGRGGRRAAPAAAAGPLRPPPDASLLPTWRFTGALALGAFVYFYGATSEVAWLFLLGFLVWTTALGMLLYARWNSRGLSASIR